MFRIDTDTLTNFDLSNDGSCSAQFVAPGSERKRKQISVYRDGVPIWGKEPK